MTPLAQGISQVCVRSGVGKESVFAGSKTLQGHGAELGAGAFTHAFLRVLHEALSRRVCLAKRQVEGN